MNRSAVCWPLLVVSSELQRETVAHYLAMAQADALAQGWCIERADDFAGIASGKRGPRELVVKLIAALKATPKDARPQWVWMRRVDRVGRGRIADSQLAMHELIDLGVRIWDHDNGEVRLESAIDQIINAVKQGLGTLENEVRAGKMRANYARKRAANLPLSPQRPYGLRLDPATKQDVPLSEQHAALVREIFRLRLEHYGYHRIGKALEPIAPPYVRKDGSTRPPRFTITAVQRILTQRQYVAAGIIDEVTFLRVQAAGRAQAAKYPPRQAVHPWPLSGALRCWCGRSMSGATSTSGRTRTKRVRYYRCYATYAHAFRFRQVRADRLETAFAALLSRLRDDPALVGRYRAASTLTAAPELLERRARECRARLGALDRARAEVWRLHAAGNVRDEDVQERLDALAAERTAVVADASSLQEQIALASVAQQSAHEASALFARAAALWEAGAVDDRRSLAIEIGAEIGGLCVEEDGSLSVRAPLATVRDWRPAERIAGSR